jgi:F-box-like
VKDITDRLKAAQEECDRLELEWHSYSSTLSPIRPCPPEILSMIFRIYLAENPRRVRRLLLVCRQWHEVAKNDPQLWNRIRIKVNERDWNLKSMSKSYEKHTMMCLQRSGASLLDIEVDCEELRSSRHQILDRINEPFARQLGDGTDAEIAFSNWLDNLELDELDTPAVTATCQPKHIVRAIKLIAGKNGEHMSRWGSLHFTFPLLYDPKTVASLWKLFRRPTPCLNRLILVTPGFSSIHDTDLEGCFPDLPTLKHLHVDSIQVFRFLTLNSPIESLVIHGEISDWWECNLSQFTHLQYLEAYIDRFSPHYDPIPIEVSLPLLKRLALNGILRRLSEVQFNTPILQDLSIRGRTLYEISRKPDFLPGLQSLRVCWMGSNYTGKPWRDEILTKEMKIILAHFHKAKQLTVSSNAKHALIEALHLLRGGEGLLDLETIRFENREGGVETIDVQTLLMPNSS